MVVAIFVVISTILIKAMDKNIYDVNSPNYNPESKVVLYQKIVNIISFFTIIILIIGNYKYYLRQSKEHSKDWSWILFWFGTNTICKK